MSQRPSNFLLWIVFGIATIIGIYVIGTLVLQWDGWENEETEIDVMVPAVES